MKNISLTLITLLFLGCNILAQAPCVNGVATLGTFEFPCSGYDIMSVVLQEDVGITGNMSDCWGWTDPETAIEYAIICGSNRTVFVDMEDPVNPVFMGYLPSATGSSIWRDVKVYNDHAFIVSEASGHGMQVFDLTRLRDDFAPPMAFDADAWLEDFGHSHNIAINEETGYAYPVGTDGFAGGPYFVNIQDPLNPITEGGYDGDGYTHDAQIIIYDGPDEDHQCKEIFFGFNANTLTIVDVTDKTDPTLISTTGYENTGYTHQGWLNEDRTIVYMNDETDEINIGNNTRTLIMDVSDLDNPVLVTEYLAETTASDHNLYVHGDKVFQSNYLAGFRVLQITDVPETPLEEVGYMDFYPNNSGAGTSGSWSNYPYFESGNIVNSGSGGFVIVHSSTILVNDVDPVLIDCSTGISEITAINFSIYPNPTKSVINITSTDEQVIETILITDMVGKQVHLESNLRRMVSHQIDISDLAPGTYFLNVNNENRSLKFVVE